MGLNKKTTLIQSFKFASQGIKFAVVNNRNIRIQMLIGFLIIALSFYFKLTIFEASLIGIMILFVLSTEMMNTVVEEMVNLLTKDYRIEAKIAKDVSAGMVLLASIASVIIGIIIFLPHLLKFFR